MSTADKLRAQGEVLGMRRVLLHLLQETFGPLSAEVEPLVASTSEAEVLTWSGRVLRATSLDEVFAD